MNIVLLGAPGSGKGTQAEFICNYLLVPHVSTGDIFRENISKGTELGKKVKALVDEGKLVPDDLVWDIVYQELKKDIYTKGFVLDGFPRTLNQAIMLDKSDIKIDKAIYINTPDEEIIKRITGRRMCPSCKIIYNIHYMKPKIYNKCDNCGEELVQRTDDTEEVIIKRLEAFKSETMPVVEFYASKGILFEVNGADSVENIKNKILSLF